MKQKQFFSGLLLIFLVLENTFAQIPPGIFGQNANLTKQVGTHISNGHLDEYWDRYGSYSAQDYFYESGTLFGRYGGIEVEKWCKIDGNPANPAHNISITIADYKAKAIAMQDNGVTPMMTLPLNLNFTTDFTTTATKSGMLVKGVNDALTATYNSHTSAYYEPVIYWVYSNEPEDGGGLHGYDGTDAAQKIHDYIQAIHDEVTNTSTCWNSSWGTIKLIGPELYSFDNYNHGTGHVNRLLEQLTGQYNQLGGSTNAFDITPYIDYFSWHFYPFNDESAINVQGIADPTRQNVIDRLSQNNTVDNNNGGYTRKLKDDIDALKGWIALSANSSVQLAITETNICHTNDVASANGADDLIGGSTATGTNSYIAGQFWAELMAICMEEDVQIVNFWSSLEGTGPNYETDIGYLNSKPARFGGLGGKKPTYYHYQMMAKNFEGTFISNSYSSTNPSELKAFAYEKIAHDTIGVLIMNQDDSGSYYTQKTFTISLNDGDPADGDLRVKLDLAFPLTVTPGAKDIAHDTGYNIKLVRSDGSLIRCFLIQDFQS